jgi:hypothetical protein
VRELERFRWLHLYADRVLIKKGEYVAAAGSLERRARRSRAASFLLCALFLVQGARDFVHYGQSPHLASLLSGSLQLLFAVFWAVQGCHAVARTAELRRHLEALFPDQTAPTHEVIAA